jgi:hypothetical protein
VTEQTMSEEGFLRRWARRKTEIQEGRALAPAPEPEPQAAPQSTPEPAVSALAESRPGEAAAAPASAPAQAPAPALPTMEDVALLDADSDFSSFVARGVDQAVRRGALKKLFADPHFKLMDKLDVYIDDYTKPSPVSEAMLASLAHAKSVFMRTVQDEEGRAAPAQAEQAEPPAALAAPAAPAVPEAQIEQLTEQAPEQETP